MAAAQTNTDVPNHDRPDQRRNVFVFDVDDVTYEHDHPPSPAPKSWPSPGSTPAMD
jgi:hypothetical protein